MKADAPMVFNVSGKMIFVNEVQFSNAYFSSVCNPFGRVISFKDVQFSKADFPMVSMEDGSWTDNREVQFLNAEAPSAVILYPSMDSLIMMEGELQLPMPVMVQVFLSAFTVYLSPVASTGSIGFSIGISLSDVSEGDVV